MVRLAPRKNRPAQVGLADLGNKKEDRSVDAVKTPQRASPQGQATLFELSELHIDGNDLAGPLMTLADYLTGRKAIEPAQRAKALALIDAGGWESAVIALLPPGTSYSIGHFPDLGECVAQVTLRNVPGAHARGSDGAPRALLRAFLAALQRAG